MLRLLTVTSRIIKYSHSLNNIMWLKLKCAFITRWGGGGSIADPYETLNF